MVNVNAYLINSYTVIHYILLWLLWCSMIWYKMMCACRYVQAVDDFITLAFQVGETCCVEVFLRSPPQCLCLFDWKLQWTPPKTSKNYQFVIQWTFPKGKHSGLWILGSLGFLYFLVGKSPFLMGKSTITGWWFGTWMDYDFPFSWECHHPNWQTHIFQRGRYTTNQFCFFFVVWEVMGSFQPLHCRDFSKFRWVSLTKLGSKSSASTALSPLKSHRGMDQYLLIPFLVGWTSIYQLFWCSPGVQGFDTLP